MERIASLLRARAAEGHHDGTMTLTNRRYIETCTAIHSATRSAVIFTRDTGHHTSGWLKNPDFERCLHLSISVAPSALLLPQHMTSELDRHVIKTWVELFFGKDANKALFESAKTPDGISRGVQHWRAFCDPAWQPIDPRGEVYSTQLTELGWKSASEVLGQNNVNLSDFLNPG